MPTPLQFALRMLLSGIAGGKNADRGFGSSTRGFGDRGFQTMRLGMKSPVPWGYLMSNGSIQLGKSTNGHLAFPGLTVASLQPSIVPVAHSTVLHCRRSKCSSIFSYWVHLLSRPSPRWATAHHRVLQLRRYQPSIPLPLPHPRRFRRRWCAMAFHCPGGLSQWMEVPLSRSRPN